MGSCFSIQLSGEDLNRILRFFCGNGYIRNLSDNLEYLESEMEDLKAIQQEVKNKVEREEAQHPQKLESVKVWLNRVEKSDTEFNDLRSTSHVHLQELCLCNLCSINVCSSYDYGKRVFLLLEKVKKLKQEGIFEEVAELTQLSEVEERHTWPTIGQEEMLEKAWNRLMEDGVGIMGLHGMGGVGKTTLFKKIHNKFGNIAGRFSVVIWIVVAQGAEISQIQEDIAKKLHLCDEGWTNKNERDKAADILRVLKGKKFVLMLDDIWEKVDLEAIGVPFPTKENGCKVALTTRSEEVCRRMGDHEPMEVKCLEWNEAWKLFKSKVGETTLKRDPRIEELARKVAGKCHGLPLALIVIGETMASKTRVQAWEHAIEDLTRSAVEFPDMEKKILRLLKFSYDSLADDNIKSCFLYCALFPEDYEIDIERLIDFWICEGFLGEHEHVKTAVNKGYDLLCTLISANLLTEVGTREVVMHDVLREMALWIASVIWRQKKTFLVRARVGLHVIPTVKDWGVVGRMSLMGNNIQDITCGSKCSELTTLFLPNNKLKNLSGEFIESMQRLVVLDLFGNSDISELPEQISKLSSLQYLDLSCTSIKTLPVGLQELKNLYQLNLTATCSLCSLDGISKLSRLRILKLIGSKVHGDASLVKELKLLQHLEVLTITISTESGLDQILGDQRLVNCISGLWIDGFQRKPFNISWLVSMKYLRELWVVRSHFLEIYPTCPLFNNLSKVRILHCNSIKDLTWLLLAPNLVYLNIACADEMEEIINKEKETNLPCISPFEKLEELSLSSVPKLESIYWSPLPFTVLRRLNIVACPKLRQFPLNATSVPRLGKFRITMYPPQQKYVLVWEDEDTKDRFWPLLRSGVAILET